jgi:hypothetical protein
MNLDWQNEVVKLLTMIRSGSSRKAESAALFLDELAAMVSHAKLHEKVQVIVSFMFMGRH